MALIIKSTSAARKYLESLDKNTQRRIWEKLQSISENPTDPRHSKPLIGSGRRAARVGDYRILFEVDDKDLSVIAIGPRGQIYRKI